MKVRTLIGILVIAFVLAAGVGASATTAAPKRAATATTCAQFGYGIKIGRNGYFCSTIAGSGTFVSYVSGYFGWVVPYLQQICYPSMKVDFYDSNGWYAWKPGGQLSGCYKLNVAVNLPTIYLNKYMRPGRARVSLLQAGSTVAEIWFGIHS